MGGHVSIVALTKPYDQVEKEGRRSGREVDVTMLHIHHGVHLMLQLKASDNGGLHQRCQTTRTKQRVGAEFSEAEIGRGGALGGVWEGDLHGFFYE